MGATDTKLTTTRRYAFHQSPLGELRPRRRSAGRRIHCCAVGIYNSFEVTTAGSRRQPPSARIER
jgi:hypothetical protein